MAAPEPLFPQTRWSLVRDLSSPEDAAGRAALETLCETYWYPLYAFVRRSGLQESDASDIVQETFARLLVDNRIASADINKGRLRAFLLTAVRHVITEQWRMTQAQKRGGGIEMLSLDMKDAEGRYLEETEGNRFPQAPSLDQYFERQWAIAVLQAAKHALRTKYHAEGKGALFDALAPALEPGSQSTHHAETAAKLGMSEEAVKVALHRLRKRFGEALKEEVLQTVTSEAEANEEFQLLMAAFAH